MVGNLKCIARQCIKFSEGKKGGLSEPPQTLPAYSLIKVFSNMYIVGELFVEITVVR